MQPSRENEKAKQTTSKGEARKTASSKSQDPLRQPVKKSSRPPLPAVAAVPSIGPVLTQEEFRARVARKAFELYENRRSLTEVDDWMEAERLVKLELLGEQRGGSI
jgi:hypothetical protein